ncbi:MAG: GGDEF domain-containing protein, partial [Pseudomonadales bacterium]|nr:GGDEF domain-containing protein [Pseudomonadales bacterium]
SRTVRLLFPVMFLAPVTSTLYWRGTTDDVILASMALVAIAYIILTAKTASHDYWQAISSQIHAEHHAAEMEKLSITDQLTRLKNRSYFDARFSEEWKRSVRQKTPLSILMIDLDHFKSLNDTYGHMFGDEVLRVVASVLDEELHRDSDLIARYGGEEFVALLPDTDEGGARLIGERMRKAIHATHVSHEGKLVHLSCSVGGATALPVREEEAGSLLKRADMALYQAKENGRNQYRASAPSAKIIEVRPGKRP